MNPEHHKEENIEEEISSTKILNDLENDVIEVERKLKSVDESKLSAEQKTILQKSKERISKTSRKLWKTIKWSTIVGSAFLTVNYEITHSDLEITDNPDGTKTFEHEDYRTTHLLNVVAGREKINETDLIIEYRAMIKVLASRSNIDLPMDDNKMSIDDIEEFLSENIDKINALFEDQKIEYKKGDMKKEFEKELKNFNEGDLSPEYVRTPDIYNLVWQMEQECGNPKIRTQLEGYGFTPVSDFSGAAHYSSIGNTIYVDLYDLRFLDPDNSIVGEMTHSKQYKEDPIRFNIGFAKDIISAIRSAGISDLDKIGDEYKKLYGKPGTMEHEAHKIIEPYLMSKYKLFIKKEAEKQQ